MSSFMVDSRTVDRVLSFLYWKKRDDPWCTELLRRAGHGLESTKDLNGLGMAMLRLNREAVNQRYGEDEKVKGRYRFSDTLIEQFQALKSLNCLLYQCSEGTVPDNPLFKALSSIADRMAQGIVSDLPEYQRAEWG